MTPLGDGEIPLVAVQVSPLEGPRIALDEGRQRILRRGDLGGGAERRAGQERGAQPREDGSGRRSHQRTSPS